jgi:hypothetical protein
MGQSIAGASGAIIPNKVSDPVEQQNVINNEAAGENTDLNSLAPFIQLLNQQITLLNPIAEPVVELTNELGEKISSQKNISVGDFSFSKDENINGLLKQSRMQSMVKELPGMKGTLPDLEGIGKNTLFKNEDSKSIADLLADQLLKANNLKLAESKSVIDNVIKSSAGNIVDKSGLANMDALRAFPASMAENLKNALKETNIIGDKNSQDISSNSLSVANNGMVKVSSLDDISATQIINRISGEIKENVSTDGGRIKITLSPPSLGTLEMDVTVRNNKVEVIIIADNKDVQQALNTHLDRLKGSLLNHGLTIDRCDVLMQNNREGYQQNYSQQTFHRDGSERNETSKEKYNEELKPITSVQPQIISSPSLRSDNISIFA